MRNTIHFTAVRDLNREPQASGIAPGLLTLMLATLAITACKPSTENTPTASTAAASSAGTPAANIPDDAPPSDQPQSQDLIDAVKDADLAPPPSDPRDFNGVWFPEGGGPNGGPRERIPYLPGKEPPPPKLGAGEAAASNAVICVPSVNGFGGAGGGMVDLYVQNDKELVALFEEHSHRRQILIGVEHPKKIEPSVTGHSVAKWDGDTLVVDTIGIMDEDIIRSGKPHVASALHVTERIRKVRDGRYLEHQVTYDDPTTYSKPYTRTWTERWRPDLDINENICEQAFDRFQIVDGRIVTGNTAPSEKKQ